MADDVNGGGDPDEGDGDEAVTGETQFPMGLFEPADRKTLKNLIAGGLPVEMTVSMGAAEVPLRGGLPDPNQLHRFLVTARFHMAAPIAQYDSDGHEDHRLEAAGDDEAALRRGRQRRDCGGADGLTRKPAFGCCR